MVFAGAAMKDSDFIRQTFHGKGWAEWVERNGVTTRGVRPAWLDWPMHTAAEMGEKWEAPSGKQKRA